MKTGITVHIAAIGVSGLLLSASAQPASLSDEHFMIASSQPSVSQTVGQRGVSATIVREGTSLEAVATAFTPRAQPVSTKLNDLNMNFVNAPLNQVLSYLSDAAGFIIVRDPRANINGYVTIQGSHITQDEAVDLLNSQLNQNSLAAIRDQRTLTILNKSDARTSVVRETRKRLDLMGSIDLTRSWCPRRPDLFGNLPFVGVCFTATCPFRGRRESTGRLRVGSTCQLGGCPEACWRRGRRRRRPRHRPRARAR